MAPRGPRATRARPSPPLGISAPAAAAAAPRTDTGTGNTSGSTSSAQPSPLSVSPPPRSLRGPENLGGRHTKPDCPARRLSPGSPARCRATAPQVSPPRETREAAGHSPEKSKKQQKLWNSIQSEFESPKMTQSPHEAGRDSARTSF